MENIICLKNRCLLLPVCKNKEIINCDDIFNIIDKISITIYRDSYCSKIISFFPNASFITKTNRDENVFFLDFYRGY